MSSNRTCILIYGMHRSGTSALSGAINAAGIHFGKSITPPSFDNPKGFFENYKVQEFNDVLLQSLDRTWQDTRPLKKDWLARLDSYRLQAKNIIKEEYSGVSVFAIKDPRFSLLLPFWENILNSLEISVKNVVVLRHPYEIIKSLQSRNYFHTTKVELLIKYYLLSAERNSRNKARTFVHYDELISDTFKCISELIQHFKLSLSIDHLDSNEINTAIHKKLRNHKTQALTQQSHPSFNLQEIPNLISGSLTREAKNELNRLYQDYIKIDEQHHLEVSQLTGKIAKLLFNYGQGYRESHSVTKPVEVGQQQLEFDNPSKESKVHEITLSPVLHPCIIRINKIDLGISNEQYELSENSTSFNNGLLNFQHNHPRIILKFKVPVQLSTLRFDLDFIEFSTPSTELLIQSVDIASETKQNERLFYKVAKSIFFNPIQFVKNINYQNFRTLQSALRRESPQQIIRNFRKLIERQNTQKSISDISSDHDVKMIKEVYDKRTDKAVVFKVLFVTPQLPEYDTSSGGRRAIAYLTLLDKFSEVYIFTAGHKKSKYVQDLKNRGFYIVDTAHTKNVKEELPYIHVLLYSWYYSFHDSKALTNFYKNALVIIDSVDVQWVREERSIGIQSGLDRNRVAKNKKSEIEAYSFANRVWAVSQPDKNAIISEIPECTIDIISNIHNPIKTKYQDPGTNSILFIGGYNHYPNLSAIQLLALKIFPKVLLQIPSARLLIAGSNAPEEVIQLGQLNNVEYLGFIPEHKLSDLYERSLLSVSPLLTGAGVKGKITEAIAHMVPVVTNEIGNEGIDLVHELSGLIVKDSNRMAEVIVNAMKRAYDFKAMTERAQSRLVEMSNPDEVLQKIKKSILRTVDICIVSWNKVDMLKTCIQSILTHTEFSNYNIIVYSNGCTDGTQEYLLDLAQNHQHVACILSETNDVFVKPNNQMILMNPEHDKVLLNNDVVVTQGWLSGLYNCAYSSSDIGIVGAKVLFLDGRLQEFGSEIYKDGSGQNIGKWDDHPMQERYNQVRAVGYVSGCTMYIKRTAIDVLEGFNEAFHPCYYEDSDLCYRAWENDIITVVTPDSVVHHHEGATSGTNEQVGFKSFQNLNREKFVTYHKGHIKDIQRKIKKINRTLSKNYK